MPGDSIQSARHLDKTILTAIKTGLNFAYRYTVSTLAALYHANIVGPEVFPPNHELFQTYEPEKVRFYREKALALSEIEGRQVAPLQLVNEDIAQLEPMLYTGQEQERRTIERELRKLYEAACLLRSDELVRISEDKAIDRDVYQVKRGLPISGQGNGYIDFELDDKRWLRIRKLHPGAVEGKTGVDLMYEKYDHLDRVRLVAVQYKMWDSKKLYFSEHRGLQKQLDRLLAAFCSTGLCRSIGTVNTDMLRYRFPCCVSFLRLTDYGQTRNPMTLTQGIYVPVCEMARCTTETSRGGRVIRKSDVKASLSQRIFEELFIKEMIGSDWVNTRHLLNVHGEFGDLWDSLDAVTIHMQEYV